MSNYVFGTSLSYVDYLQARSFETSFKAEVSNQTRSIIGSAKDLHAEQITVLKDGFEQLSFNVQALNEGISELNATFEWGFSNLVTVLERVSARM